MIPKSLTAWDDKYAVSSEYEKSLALVIAQLYGYCQSFSYFSSYEFYLPDTLKFIYNIIAYQMSEMTHFSFVMVFDS